MDRHLVAGTTVGIAGPYAVRAFDSGRVFKPRRAVRELDGADFGDHGGAAWNSWCGRGGDGATPRKRRLLPGRSAGHDGIVVEERHPDRRVRARSRAQPQMRRFGRGFDRRFALTATFLAPFLIPMFFFVITEK